MDIAEIQRRMRQRLSQALVQGSSLSMLSQAIVSGSNFLTAVIVAKALGVSDFGVYSLIGATILALQGIQQALITSPMMFLSSGRKDDEDRFSQYFILQIAISFPSALITASAIEVFLGEWNVNRLLTVVLAVMFLQFQEFSRVRLYIDLKAVDVLALDCINHILRLSVLLFLWKVELLTVTSAFVVLAGASAVSSFRILLALRSQPVASCVNLARRSFRYGRWLLLESFAYYLSVPLYLYLTSMMLSYEATGGLSAAIALLNLPNVLVLGLMNLAIPAARQKLLAQGYDAWRSQLVSTGVLVAGSSVFLYFLISMAGPYLLGMLYSPEFEKFSEILPIVAAYYCFLAVGSVLAAAFRLAQTPQIGAMTKLWSSAITACIAYPLINGWGLLGASLGLVVTSATWLTLYALYIYKGALSRESVLQQRFGT